VVSIFTNCPGVGGDPELRAAHRTRRLKVTPAATFTGVRMTFVRLAIGSFVLSGIRGRALPRFLDFYNMSRSHSALGHIPPLLNFLERREQRP
jgi:hypothetical protein